MSPNDSPQTKRRIPLDDVLGLLRCPHCRQGLTRRESTLCCPAGHSFDIARQGYVNLVGHAPPRNADTAAMVGARERFLATGHYQPIADAAAAELEGVRTIVEVGAGPGYYLRAALAALPATVGLATDVSPAAMKRAASSGLAAVVADTWAGLPLADHCLDAVLCVFAPRNPTEFARVLRTDGRVVVVIPSAAHLQQARDRLGLLGVEPDKAGHLAAGFAAAGFRLASQSPLAYQIRCSPQQLTDLVEMGPNAFHAHAPAVEKLQLDVAVQVSVFVT